MLSRTNIMNVVTNVSYECIMNAVSHDTRSSIHKCLLRTFINVCTLDLHKCSPLRISVSLTNPLSRSPGRSSRSVARTPSLWARTPSLWASSRKRLSVDRVEKEGVCWERESERKREKERAHRMPSTRARWATPRVRRSWWCIPSRSWTQKGNVVDCKILKKRG